VDPKLIKDLQATIVQKSQGAVKEPPPFSGTKDETIVPGIRPVDPSRRP
jgi:hypothetical protein